MMQILQDVAKRVLEIKCPEICWLVLRTFNLLDKTTNF